MSERPQEGLALEAVVRRFADSERALREVHGRLETLASSAESSQASAAALAHSADAVRSFTEAATRVVEELGTVSAQTRQVLEGGAAMLDGSAVRSLEEAVARIGGSLEELRAEAAAERAALDERLERLEERLAAIDGRVGLVGRWVEHLYAVLPGRWKRGTESPGDSAQE
jgi:predicted  nucleic acid-binding Zn-ribbon protein